MFKKATKSQARLRMAVVGPAGSGKTYTALQVARHLGKSVALIDTEHGSASKYANECDFDVCELSEKSRSPEDYIKAIRAAMTEYDVLIIDSLTHEWEWCLAEVDRVAKSKTRGNSYMAWGEVTPRHRKLLDAILSAKCHVIATMRTKTAYELVENGKGKVAPKKIGLAPIQREGADYEFDVVLDIGVEHVACVSKSRCVAISDKTYDRPGQDLAEDLKAWLTDGAPLDDTMDAADAAVADARPSADAVRRFSEALREAPDMDELEAIRRDMSETKGDMTVPQQRALANEFAAAVARLQSGDGVTFSPGDGDVPA